MEGNTQLAPYGTGCATKLVDTSAICSRSSACSLEQLSPCSSLSVPGLGLSDSSSIEGPDSPGTPPSRPSQIVSIGRDIGETPPSYLQPPVDLLSPFDIPTVNGVQTTNPVHYCLHKKRDRVDHNASSTAPGQKQSHDIVCISAYASGEMDGLEALAFAAAQGSCTGLGRLEHHSGTVSLAPQIRDRNEVRIPNTSQPRDMLWLNLSPTINRRTLSPYPIASTRTPLPKFSPNPAPDNSPKNPPSPSDSDLDTLSSRQEPQASDSASARKTPAKAPISRWAGPPLSQLITRILRATSNNQLHVADIAAGVTAYRNDKGLQTCDAKNQSVRAALNRMKRMGLVEHITIRDQRTGAWRLTRKTLTKTTKQQAAQTNTEEKKIIKRKTLSKVKGQEGSLKAKVQTNAIVQTMRTDEASAHKRTQRKGLVRKMMGENMRKSEVTQKMKAKYNSKRMGMGRVEEDSDDEEEGEEEE